MSESVWSLVRVGKASAMWVSKLSTLKGSEAMIAVYSELVVSVYSSTDELKDFKCACELSFDVYVV